MDIKKIIEEGFTFYFTRWSDEPIDPNRDIILYTDPKTGRRLVAKAPLNILRYNHKH